jgi:hypothetical protein
MRTFHDKYAKDLYSQTGEDGIIEECLRRLKIKTGRFVEFGAHDGKFCSNTRLLLESGWSGKLIESSPELFKKLLDNNITTGVGLYCGMVTPENVNNLVPKDIQVLSIDVDGNDYNIWKAYEGRPPIVIIEINSSIHPDADGPVSDLQYGTGYKPMVQLGIAKGYFLLTHHGNCIFVANEHRSLFSEIVGDGLENADLYFSKAWL